MAFLAPLTVVSVPVPRVVDAVLEGHCAGRLRRPARGHRGGEGHRLAEDRTATGRRGDVVVVAGRGCTVCVSAVDVLAAKSVVVP